MLGDDTALADATLVPGVDNRLCPNKVILPVGLHRTLSHHVNVRVECMRCRHVMIAHGKLKYFCSIFHDQYSQYALRQIGSSVPSCSWRAATYDFVYECGQKRLTPRCQFAVLGQKVSMPEVSSKPFTAASGCPPGKLARTTCPIASLSDSVNPLSLIRML